MKDTIDRQEAIDALNKLDVSDGVGISSVACDLQEEAIRSIENLLSAQPERQKGEWIDYTEDGYVECPFCHNATNCDGNKDELHFCFSCGADMREVEQE